MPLKLLFLHYLKLKWLSDLGDGPKLICMYFVEAKNCDCIERLKALLKEKLNVLEIEDIIVL